MMKVSVHTRDLVTRALAEDIGRGDLTTTAMNLGKRRGEAILLAKSSGILSGSAVCCEVFRQLDRRIKIRWQVRDGQLFHPGTKLATIEGRLSALLTGERTALNFLAHLSGIATLTRRFVKLTGGTKAQVLDTRKTTPGLRELEKQAVKAGGGVNHRMGLDDVVMIKNNHLTACAGIEAALAGIQNMKGRSRRDKPIICETRTMSEVRLAVQAGIDWILLDHFGPARLRRIVKEIRKFERQTGRRIILENSGGLNLRNIRSRAQTGVDYLSVGALTQSAPAVDISLRII